MINAIHQLPRSVTSVTLITGFFHNFNDPNIFTMKKKLLHRIPVILLAIALVVTGCSKDNETGNTNNNKFNNGDLAAQLTILPNEPLNADELSTLPFMREEEKLARDVYIFLHNKWGSLIFSNISNSEQTHMNAVLLLLNKYNIPDPVGSNGIGVFNNPVLQNLYVQLTAQGSASTLEALKVGATIEDLDIYDLKTALAKVDNQDIILVYNNLMKGSRNHLRSFYSNIQLAGATYIPQYISQAELDAIISSPMETGSY